MKKWICALLCLCVAAGMFSLEADASGEQTTKKNPVQIWSTQTAETETSSVETAPAETGKPQTTQQPSAAEQVIISEETTSVSGKKSANLKQVTLNWTAVNGAVSYHIYRKCGKEKYSFYKNVTELSFVDKALKAGATYKYKIYPVFSAANGESVEGYASNEVSFSLVPAKLKNVRAKGVRGGIQVRWKRNKKVTGYQVYMKVHVKGFKTKFNKVKTIKKNKVTGYRCKMLVRGMKYSYKVRSFKTVNGKKIYGPFVTVTTKAK